ncbi:MAG: three-Cys-motif partner protein TcmP [Rhodospirillales bacterium]|nr:MAG: three-Cys-motif partner protein TcmP [Rhodospirillales bacterium]
MPPKIENYQGREHSFIKHLFLNKYLEAAAYKLFQKRSPVFNFVDAFAGPWRVSDTDRYSDASFSQAIETLEAVRRRLLDMGRPGLKVRFRFCERIPASVGQLKQFAAQKPEFDIMVFSGAFEDNLDGIRNACREGFTFTFIDPTGWNIESSKVFDFLRQLNGEFLFNFMAEEVNRHGGWDGVADSVGRFLADPAWKAAFEALPEGTNETKIRHLLKVKMKEAKVATYLTEMAIRKPREDRIKMRLILGYTQPVWGGGLPGRPGKGRERGGPNATGDPDQGERTSAALPGRPDHRLRDGSRRGRLLYPFEPGHRTSAQRRIAAARNRIQHACQRSDGAGSRAKETLEQDRGRQTKGRTAALRPAERKAEPWSEHQDLAPFGWT